MVDKMPSFFYRVKHPEPGCLSFPSSPVKALETTAHIADRLTHSLAAGDTRSRG